MGSQGVEVAVDRYFYQRLLIGTMSTNRLGNEAQFENQDLCGHIGQCVEDPNLKSTDHLASGAVSGNCAAGGNGIGVSSWHYSASTFCLPASVELPG